MPSPSARSTRRLPSGRWAGSLRRALCLSLAALAGLSSAVAAAPIDQDRVLATRYGNDAAWYRDNIPLFESSDPQLDAVYYYRWSVYRAHQRDLGAKGYITTEFMDDVVWQREPYASLNDATGFHLYEGRWLRARRYAGDYIDFLYQEGGNDRHFSEAIADAVWARYLVDHDAAVATRHLPAMRHIYGLWDDHFDFDKGLYWVEPLMDATEYTVSSIDTSGGKDGFTGGHAFRPTINGYMFANARAIARLSDLAGDVASARDYDARADRLKTRITTDLWSGKLGHFIDRHRIENEYVHYWQPIRARELAGYLPWTFGVVEGASPYDGAWRHLLSKDVFAGAAGPRTVEPSYEYYMRQYRYDKETGQRECQWNGPVWPFQTTQVLTALARRLHAGGAAAVSRADYLALLRQYARLHYQADRIDLEEDYDPETGKPIVGLARSHHYFHSGFDDLVISGLVGLQPLAGDELTVDPLVPAGGLSYFALQDVPYHGRLVTVTWDAEGGRYGAGLRVYVDGTLAGSRADLGPLTVSVEARANPPAPRPLAKSIQLVRSGFPRALASSGSDPEKLHDALDGRVWFFPELPNGWESSSVKAQEWFAIDFGEPMEIGAGELSFFEGGNFAAPTRVRIQYQGPKGWTDLTAGAGLANGTQRLGWTPVTARHVRLLIDKAAGRQVRLAEFKLF
ncbi:MGH1-like glycoside hydrolase domain-containing protein [Sphingomonas sp. ID0503]|uniref:MGH1-like glycoside hydrolase domain-containing protein n=1 Tax=Sphingomonas sp. ID0503 TaxID=3399691 RepID=UPI003AFB2166